MEKIVVKVVYSGPQPTEGSAGIKCHAPGYCTTVSNISNLTGGIENGNLTQIETK